MHSVEDQERQRWDNYARAKDGLKNYEAWLARPGPSRVHSLYRRYVTGRRILEIGCGAGHVMSALMKDDPQRDITGLDISEEMLKLAAARGCRSLVCGSGNDLSGFAPESFDTVIAPVWVFRYLHPDKVLSEVRRVLRPGGELLFDIPLFFGTLLEAFSAAAREPWRWRRAFRSARLHMNPASANTWSRRLTGHGFCVVRTVGILEIPVVTHRFRWAPYVENRWLQHLCLNVFYHAAKVVTHW